MRRMLREVASRQAAATAQVSMGGPPSTDEEFNTSITSGEGDATLQNQSDIMDQDETLPSVKSVDKITAQSVAAPVDVTVSTVWNHDYSTIQSEKICKLSGHSDEACQFPSGTLLDNAHNHNKTSVSSRMTDVNYDYMKSLELECQSLRSKCHTLEAENAQLSLSEKKHLKMMMEKLNILLDCLHFMY